MKPLTQAEQDIMNYLWKEGEGFLKDIVEEYPEPRPAYTTIATVLNRMCKKGYIDFSKHGRDKMYFPVLQKKEYFRDQLKGMISHFFDNSAAQFASFFTRESDLSVEQLEELQQLIDQRLQEKKN